MKLTMMKRAKFKPNPALPIPQLLWKKVPGAKAVSAVVAAIAVVAQVSGYDTILLKNLFLDALASLGVILSVSKSMSHSFRCLVISFLTQQKLVEVRRESAESQ